MLPRRRPNSAYLQCFNWLNLAENLFGKMARTFLKTIRVESCDELKLRILKGVEEMNRQPTIFRWTKFEQIKKNPAD